MLVLPGNKSYPVGHYLLYKVDTRIHWSEILCLLIHFLWCYTNFRGFSWSGRTKNLNFLTKYKLSIGLYANFGKTTKSYIHENSIFNIFTKNWDARKKVLHRNYVDLNQRQLWNQYQYARNKEKVIWLAVDIRVSIVLVSYILNIPVEYDSSVWFFFLSLIRINFII